MADNSQRISEIRSILAAGVKKVVVDGTVVEYDLAQLRKELKDLLRSDDSQRHRRPFVSSIDLSGA